MSVIVKGMKMPENCGTCFVGNRTICKNGCPLGALPDHHGRLVDADALNFSSMLDSIDQGIAEETVMEVPTIVEAEDDT